MSSERPEISYTKWELFTKSKCIKCAKKDPVYNGLWLEPPEKLFTT
jgi:hypothetical protein